MTVAGPHRANEARRAEHAARVRRKMAERDDYREAVEGWVKSLRRAHAGASSYPPPPHRAEAHVGECAPCDALRLLAGKTPPERRGTRGR